MIQISCNEGKLGTVTQVNDQIYRFLGVVEEDVMYQKIGNLMPKVFSINHNEYLKHFLKSEIKQTAYKERIIYPMHQNGYLIPCTSLLRVLPDLNEGVQLVLFLQKIKIGENPNLLNLSAPCYLIINDTGILLGASFASKKLLDITVSFIFSHFFSLI